MGGGDTGATPVPAMETVWGEPAALSVKFKEAERAPDAAGVNTRLTPQLALAAKVEPQVLVMAKSEAFAPVSTMLEMLSTPMPLLVRVTVKGALDVPTF